MLLKVFVLFTFIFAICNAATFTFSGTNNNLWNNNLNWGPNFNAVPGAGDIAIINGGNCVFTSGSGIQELIINAGTFYVSEASSFSTTNVTSSMNSNVNIYVSPGSTLNVANYWNFLGTKVDFQNFGTINMNPRFNSGSISNSGNSTVNFRGTLSNIINTNFNIPSGFSFAQSAQTFFSEIAISTLSFFYRETIATQGWSLDNNNKSPDLVFNAGVVINGAITSTNDTIAKNSVQIQGTSSINADTTWNVNPSFIGGSNGVFFDGTNRLSFFNKDLVISTNTIGGTGSLQFTQQANTIQTVTLNNNINITNANINFIGTWYFSASSVKTLTYTTSGRVINQNYTADGVNIEYPSGTQMQAASNLNLAVLNGGTFSFLDSLGVAQLYTWSFQPYFRCSPPANTFALSGNTQNFDLGIRIFACAFTTVTQINVKTSVVTSGGNSTLPPTSQVNYPASISFSSTPLTSYSIRLTGDSTIPASNNWLISNELIIAGTLTMSTDASTSGSGQLTVTGASVSFTQNIVGSLLCFNSGTVTLSSANRVSLNGGLYLRNTYLTGTADIWLGNNNIYLTKGLSTIDNPNFKFKSGVVTNVNFDGVGVNPGAQLDITGSGNTFRTIENGFTASNKVNIVFRDQVQYNTTLSFVTDTSSAITFMQTSTSISGGYDIIFNGNFYFNGTSTNLIGQGSYSFGSNAFVYLTGSLNVNGVTNNLAPIFFSSVTLFSLNDLTIGSVVVFNDAINFRDNDNTSTTATTTVTLQNDRRMDGTWTYGSNVIVGGNIILNNAGGVFAPGYLQINGNQVLLDSNFLMYCRFILTNPTTILSFDATPYSLSLGEINTDYVAHGLTLPTLTIQDPITLIVNNGQSSIMNVLFNGNIGGTGFLSLSTIVGTTTSALTFSSESLSLSSVTLVGSGSFTLSPKSSSITFGVYAYAQTTATVTVSQITGNSNIEIIGFLFTANPTNFVGANSYRFRDSRTVSTNYVATSSLQFLGDLTLGGSISGSGSITFNAGVILLSSQSITTNPVTFGTTVNSLVVVSGSTFTLSLSGTSVTVNGRVVSGGASIVSSSPLSNAYTHSISGGGVIPAEWIWSNTIKLGLLNVTGARTLSFPIQLTFGETTTFNDGITFTNTGSFLPDTDGVASLFVEKGITSNTNVVIPFDITVTTSGQSTFNFAGTNVLQINGTFNCQTRLNFATSVTFGYDISRNLFADMNIQSGCFFFGSSQTLIINRQNLKLLANSPTNIYFEPTLTFGLLPPFSTTISSTGNSVLLLKGNINVLGNKFATSSGNKIFLDAITISTFQNSTLTNLNPNATLTFVSTTNPWVEPLVTFNGELNQNINLNGPIRIFSQTIGPKGNFIGTGQNRVAFVNSLVLSATSTITYAFAAPIQFYVNSSTVDFVLSAGTNNFYFNQVPSLFNPLGLAAPNFRVQGQNAIVRFSFTGSVTFGNVWVEGSGTRTTLRLTSGVTFNAATLTVNGLNNFWVDSATVNLENLFFSQDSTGDNPSKFQYTVSSATPPTVTVSKYTFYQGIAEIVVNNYVWTSGSVTAITSANSNTAGQFSRISGSPGYTFTQTKNGNNIAFSASQIPTISPFPTQSNGPSPVVSSASFIFFNFAILFSFLIYIF